MLFFIFTIAMYCLLYFNSVFPLNFGTHLSQSFLNYSNSKYNKKLHSVDDNLSFSTIESLNKLKESLGSDYFISREELVDGKYKLIWADEKMPLLRLDIDARERIMDLDRPQPFQIGEYVYVITGKLKHSRGTVLKVDREDIGGRFKVFISLDCRNEKGELYQSLNEYHGKGLWFYDSELSQTPLYTCKSPPLPGCDNYTKIINVELPPTLDDAKTIGEVIRLSDPINLCKNLIKASEITDDNSKNFITPGFIEMVTNSINYISTSPNINLQEYLHSLFAITRLDLTTKIPNLQIAISTIIDKLSMDALSTLNANELSEIIKSLNYTGNRDIRLIGDSCHLLNEMDIEIPDVLTLLSSLSQLKWNDHIIVKHLEDIISNNIRNVSRGDSISLLNYLVLLNSDNSNLIDLLYQKSVTRDSITSSYPNISKSKFILLFEAVSKIPRLYEKFLIETKRLIPLVISESHWPTLSKMISYFRNAKELDFKYYKLICSRGLELTDLTSDESLELLELASRISAPDIRLLDLSFNNLPNSNVGRCLFSLSNLFSDYKLNHPNSKKLESLIKLLVDKFNSINVELEDTLSMVKNLNKLLLALGTLSIPPPVDKALEILTYINSNDYEFLSKWSETITLLLSSADKDSIKDERFILLDQKLFDLAYKFVKESMDNPPITLVTSSLYSMSFMDNLDKRDLSLFHEFCKRNINQMDNAHLLMISDVILKLKDKANEWRAIFADIKKGINRITND